MYPPQSSNILTIKLKLMSGSEISLDLSPEELSQDISYIKSKAFAQELSEGTIVRLIYQGKLLTDDKKLSELNLS